MRVLAIFAIVVYHANTSWFPGGFLGVTVFFTLSGYLITDSLLREVRLSEGPVDVVGFYMRRLRRIVPLTICVVCTTAILCAMFSPFLLAKMRSDAIPALLYFENWWYIIREQSYFAASGLPSPITHLWFLAVIMQFYLVWPWMIIFVTRTIDSRRTQGLAVATLAIASAVLAAVLFDPTGDPSRVYYGTDTRLAEILVGACLAFWWPTDGMVGKGKEISARLSGVVGHLFTDTVGVAALSALGYLCYVMNGYSPILYRGGLLAVALLTAVAIAAFVRPGSYIARLLGCQPFVIVARRSFGIYLWHYPLLLIMNPATRTTALPWWGWALEAVAIAITVELSWRLIEEPIARLLSSKGPRDGDNSAGFFAHGALDGRVAVGMLSLIAAIGGCLIYVGPFWYEDGAALQAMNAQQIERPAAPGKTKEKEEKKVELAHNAKNVSELIAWSSEILQEKVRAKYYPVDPETGSTEAPVILIGDSVPAGAIEPFYEIFPNGLIDAEVGRQLYDADDIYLEDLADGYNQSIVIFSCGDNGVASEEDVKALIDATDGRKTYLVTARVPLPLQDMNNELFYQMADRYDNVEIIDWYGESEGHDEYFWDDGTHLRPEGAEAYVLMLRRAICGE